MLQPSGYFSNPCKGGEPWGDSGWERTGHWPQTGKVQIKGRVTGRSQLWLHAGPDFWPLLFIALVKETCPSAWMLKWLFSAHSETIWPSQSVNGCRKENMNDYHLIVQDNGLLTLLPCLLSSMFYKRTRHPDPNKMVILRHQSAIFSVCQVSK